MATRCVLRGRGRLVDVPAAPRWSGSRPAPSMSTIDTNRPVEDLSNKHHTAPVLDSARRLRTAVQLLLALKDARPPDKDPLDQDKLLRVEALARRTGGLAAMVSEIMAAYTATEYPAEEPLVLGGRAVRGRRVGNIPNGSSVAYPGAAVDASLARVAVPMATHNTSRARTAITVLDDLRRDVRHQKAIDLHEVRAVERKLSLCAPHIAGSLTVGDGGALVTTTGAPTDAIASDAVELVTVHGLVHARIGAAAHWCGDLLYVSHWETLRGISPRVRRMINSMVDPDRSWQDEVRSQAGAWRIDPGLFHDLLPVAIDAMEPLIELGAARTLASARPCNPMIPTVPDDLGLIYGVACLVGVSRLLDSTQHRRTQ